MRDKKIWDDHMTEGDRVWRERGLRAAVLAGDEEAWRTWYDECFAGLFAYVAWRCAGLRDIAEEVVQETWLVAVRRVCDFEPAQGPFAAWLRGIATNVLRNRFRKERGRPRPQPLNGALPAKASTSGERIAAALAALPEHYEAVLRAKYLDRHTVADIAALRADSVKAIESLLTRARQAFREAYIRQEEAP